MNFEYFLLNILSRNELGAARPSPSDLLGDEYAVTIERQIEGKLGCNDSLFTV